MDSHQLTPTDAELSALVRAGDREAFGELWKRHSDSAFIVARQYRGIADPQDIVQEASRRVLNAMSRGGGPFGDFRPYMNQTVRNVAVSWSRAPASEPVGDVNDLAEHVPGAQMPDSADGALERMITVRAFKSLPKRWQTVLWYTYVEGMASDEAADHLGLSRNAAAALVGRAREGLRQAWLKAHVSDETLPVDCRQVVEMLPSLERNDITDRQRAKVENHLDECSRCAIIAAEINDLAMQLPILMLPLVVAGFDVLSAHVDDLLAHNLPAVKTVGEGGQPSDAHARVLRSGRTSKTARGGVSRGRVWLLSAVVAAGIAALVVIADLGPDASGGTPVPDIVAPHTTSSAMHEPSPSPSEAAVAPVVGAPPAASPSATPTPKASPKPSPRRSASSSAPPATAAPAAVTPSASAPAPTPPPAPAPVVPAPGNVTAPSSRTIDWLDAGFTFTGTGVPGATIELLDDNSTVIETADVAADGTWSIAPKAISLTGTQGRAPTMSPVIRQRTADGVSTPVATQEYTFTVPGLGGAWTPAHSADTKLTFTGANGSVAMVSLDKGTPSRQLAMSSGAVEVSYSGLAAGEHSVDVWFVDTTNVGATETVGATVTYTFNVS